MTVSFAPLSYALAAWPGHLFGGLDFLDRVGLVHFAVTSDPGLLACTGAVGWLEEIELKLPGVDQVSIALLSAGDFTQVDFVFTILPDFSLTLPNLNATLRIRSPLLRRKKKQGNEWIADTVTGGVPKPVEIELGGVAATVTADGDMSLSTANAGLSLSPFEIGTTGLIVEATKIGLHLNANDPPPPGAQPGFKGVSIDQASLHLTGSLAGGAAPSTVTLTDVLIGSLGFSGRVAAKWSPNNQSKLFGMDCELIELGMDFRQNAPVGGGFKARIKLPFFEQPVEVEIGYTADGSLTVGLGAANSGLATLSIQNVLELELDSLKFTVDDGLLTVRLSGMIIPTLQALKVPPIRVDNLTIDSKGNVDLPGGWLELPKQYGLNFHSFKIAITKFGIGREPDGRKWIGFSGGIKLVDGLPAGVSVEGLRITCNEDWSGTPAITLQGVGIELEIKDVLYFKGAIAFRNDPLDHRFDGSIKLELKSLKFKIDGEFVVGNTASYRYMALYVGVDLPVGLPVLSTGLAVFGLEGLFARRMAPNKLPTEKWYEIGSGGWYKKVKTGVLPLRDPLKWTTRPDATALGIGLTFGTLSDNGHTLSARALFLGVFPGPTLMIDGAANLLKDRSKLGEDPLFRTLAVYDGKAGSLLVGLDIAYKYDATGKLIKLSAGTEAYYEFANPMAWRINLGLKPREQRIQARIFNMFDANAYLMLSARQVAMGCWVGYDKNWKFGPLKVALSAWMESNVVVSFKPIQFYGDMALHGGVELSAFGFGLSLTVDARVEAEVFHPKHLLAELDVTLNLPAPLPKKKRRLTAHCRIEFGPEPLPPKIPVALKSVSIEHMKVSTTWPLPAADGLLAPVFDDGQGFLATASGNVDALPPDADIPVVPMDCRPTICFNRSVHDDALVGALVQIPDPPSEWIGDPEKHEGSARVRYALTFVTLDKWTGTQWVAVAGKGAGVSGLPELFGTWTPAAAESGPGVAQNRLTLWSKCGFTSFRHTGSDYPDWFADHFGGAQGYPCVPVPGPTEICLNFLDLPLGPVDKPFTHPDHPGVKFDCAEPGRLEIKSFGEEGDRVLCSIGAQGMDILFADGADHVSVRPVHFRNMAPAEVTASGLDGEALEPVGTIDETVFNQRVPVQTIRIHPDRVGRVHLAGGIALPGGFRTCLAEVCAILDPGPAQLAAVAEASGRNSDAIGLWSGVGTVLEPHTIYRLRIGTRMEVAEFAYDDGSVNVDHDLVQAAFFRTRGPPGLVALSKPREPAGSSAQTGLEDLGLYVSQTIPPTVPARGEPPLLPRPVYRAYSVGAAFNEDYVDLMYRMAGRDLALILYDRNNQPVRGRNGGVAVAQNPWGVVETASLSETETSWLAMIAANSCVPDVDESSIPKDLTLTAPAELLAPDMLYQARLVPLLLHEDFARIGTGTGRWQPHDFTADGGASAWAIGHTTQPVAANLVQTGLTGTGQSGVAALGTAAFLTADPRAPAEDPLLWSDYRLACNLRADGGAAIGLAFRWLGPQDFHLFAMDQRAGEGRRLYRVKAGVVTVLAQDGWYFAHGQPYEVVVEAIGESLKVWIDGKILFDVVDPGAIAAGSVALHCSGTNQAIFSDVRVHDLSKAAKSAYGFSFTTSRFVNFVHHVQSHDDDAWPGPCTLPAPDFAAAAAHAVANAALPVSDEEARAFEALADDMLGARARQEPLRTETYRVESAAGDPLALLVRSPEPFDHSRLTLTLLEAVEQVPASIAPASVKLIAASLGATVPADESVTLLVREAADLSGWRLQLRDPAAADPTDLDDPALAWETLYEFGPEDRMADGTLARIHSGDPSSGPAGTLRRVERYRAASGTAGDVKLAHDRVDLRLVGPQGRTEHARRFLRDGLYAPAGVRYLRKADGTAFFMLPAIGSTGGFPEGALRMGAIYRRDNRAAVPDSLVLAEGDDKSPETTWIDIPTQGPASAAIQTA